MADAKATRTVTITSPVGLHLRAATAIAALVRQFDAEVVLGKSPERVRATDVLQLISLGAGPGEHLVLEATGPQADGALDALAQLIANNFNETP